MHAMYVHTLGHILLDDVNCEFVIHCRASLRLEDSYLHVPGHTPSHTPSSKVFRQRPDDPSVLPSLRRHQWGHLLALGNLTLKAEKTLSTNTQSGPVDTQRPEDTPQGETLPSSLRESVREEVTMLWWKEVLGVLVGGHPLSVVGEGSNLMLEWSTPTEVALLETLQHLRQSYHLFGGSERAGGIGSSVGQSSTLQSAQEVNMNGSTVAEMKEAAVESAADTKTEESGSLVGRLLDSLTKLSLSFHFTDANAFIYGLTPGTIQLVCMYTNLETLSC